ncbi:MAG: hypothetical protein JOZ05_25135, partial [Acetobacteraceae bacterium]|nr:hypothetical protein [Acetobacteraceae bacterium]
MSALPKLAVIGGDHDAADLADDTGVMRFEVERTETVHLAHDAVLVLAVLQERAELVARALEAGKLVLCPFPPAPNLRAFEPIESRAGNGRLLTFGRIADSEPGARALAVVHDGALGQLLSAWTGVRAQRGDGTPADVLDAYGWDVLDFLLRLHNGTPERIHARCESLFGCGPSPDTALLILRFAPSPIATVELSRCLPASIAACDAGETEIELIGTTHTLRAEPGAGHVRVHGSNQVTARPWSESPLSRALDRAADALESGTSDGSVLQRTRRAIAVMNHVRAQS